MKYNKFLIFLFTLSSALLISQNKIANIEVNYETKLISDSLNRDEITVMDFTLIANNVQSLYFNKDAKDFYDALLGKKKRKQDNVIVTSAGAVPKYPKHNGSVFKDNDKLIVSLPVGKYIFNFDEPKLVWEILQDTKKIKNFTCQLAKTTADNGDVFYAWFTSDIPINEGPFRFKGLLGLILEVYNKNKTISIIASDIKKSNEVIEPINYFNSVNAKSKIQYLEARSNFIENPAIYNGNIRIFDANGKETTKRISEKLKKINVFLD